MAKTEAGAEHPSLSLHSLPSESDCFGDIVTSYSEDSAALMAICIKSEPEDQHISHPEYCTEVQGFSAEEMNSGLHLDTNQIKTEILMVKIQEEGKVFCPALEQFNSPVSFLAKQYKSEADEVKVEQHSQLQETSCILNDISEVAHCMKDEWTELKLSVLSAVPCTLSKKCKSETDEVKVDQHSQLEGSCSSGSQINNSAIHSLKEVCVNLHVNEFRSVPCSSVQCKFETNAVKIEQPSQLQGSSCTELEINNSANNNSMERYPPVQVAHKLLQSNSEKLESCLIIAGADAQTKGALEQPGGCVTSTFTHKATEQPRNGGVTCSAQKWQFLQGKEVLESQSHLKIYLQNDPGYKHCCVQSGTSFSKAVQLKQHQLVHSGETPYKCSECGKTFSCLSTFQQHQLANSSKFKCIHCGKSFFRGSHLKQHQLVHSGEKPYKCSECGKTFSREYNLQLHKLVHSGEKPHECDVCGKSFSHGSTLKRHQVIHTGEKPYKCECGKSFSSKQYFKKHAATHGIFYANSP